MNEKGALNLPLMAAGLGILPKTVIEQALAKQYLNPTYSPRGPSGVAGHPIYGKKKE